MSDYLDDYTQESLRTIRSYAIVAYSALTHDNKIATSFQLGKITQFIESILEDQKNENEDEDEEF